MEKESLNIFYPIMILFGTCGNLFLEYWLCTSKGSKKRSPLLLGLIASELFVASISMPATVIIIQGPEWAKNWHSILMFLQTWPISASTFSMMVISVDRYLTIKNYRIAPQVIGRRRLLLSTVVVTWFSAGVIACLQFLYDTWKRSVVFVHVIIVHVVPLCTVLTTHLGVHSKLTALSLIARAKHGELPLPMPLLRRPTHVIIVAGIPNRNMDPEGDHRAEKGDDEDLEHPTASTLESRRRLATTLLWLTGFFVTCWIPQIVVLFLEFFEYDIPQDYQRAALLVGHSHAALSALLYSVLNRQWLNTSCKKLRFPSFHRSPTSTNEDNLGPFHPRLVRAPPIRRRSSQYLY